MDAVNSFFPMDIGMQTDGTQNGLSMTQSPQQSGVNTNAFSGNGGMNGGVFMGVSTPPHTVP